MFVFHVDNLENHPTHFSPALTKTIVKLLEETTIEGVLGLSPTNPACSRYHLRLLKGKERGVLPKPMYVKGKSYKKSALSPFCSIENHDPRISVALPLRYPLAHLHQLFVLQYISIESYDESTLTLKIKNTHNEERFNLVVVSDASSSSSSTINLDGIKQLLDGYAHSAGKEPHKLRKRKSYFMEHDIVFQIHNEEGPVYVLGSKEYQLPFISDIDPEVFGQCHAPEHIQFEQSFNTSITEECDALAMELPTITKSIMDMKTSQPIGVVTPFQFMLLSCLNKKLSRTHNDENLSVYHLFQNGLASEYPSAPDESFPAITPDKKVTLLFFSGTGITLQGVEEIILFYKLLQELGYHLRLHSRWEEQYRELMRNSIERVHSVRKAFFAAIRKLPELRFLSEKIPRVELPLVLPGVDGENPTMGLSPYPSHVLGFWNSQTAEGMSPKADSEQEARAFGGSVSDSEEFGRISEFDSSTDSTRRHESPSTFDESQSMDTAPELTRFRVGPANDTLPTTSAPVLLSWMTDANQAPAEPAEVLRSQRLGCCIMS